ncbi:MAG: OmpA family protein [Candidatus Cyclobacteriaceae bacterium M2_1C_046]
MKGIFILLLQFMIISVHAQFSMKYELKNLGRKVNTAYHEAAPVISPDGKTLYFFVTNHPDNNGSQDIWYSELQEDGSWGEASHIGKPLNNHASNQVFNILPDGRILIRGGKSKKAKGFSFTQKAGKDFANAEEINVKELDNMNVGKFYGATISSDGKHLIIYMSEKENGSFSDLYVSHLQENSEYSIPVKLGSNINTSRDEFGPFLAPDDKTLYYSSNRKDMGLGSADIYMVKRLDDTWTKWSDPVNVGRPINTSAFDAYLSVDSKNNVFVTMAGDPRDGGNLDIFQVIAKDIKIEMKGFVYNIDTNEPIEAELILESYDTLTSSIEEGYGLRMPGEGLFKMRIDKDRFKSQTNNIEIPEVFNDTLIYRDYYLKPDRFIANFVAEIFDSKTKEYVTAKLVFEKQGEIINETDHTFRSSLNLPGWYYLTASAEGYLNASDSIFYDALSDQDMSRQIYLTPIEIGTTVRLKNIYFDFDKTTLQSISFTELNKVVDLLTSNPNVEIEISGHTDSKGADEYNLNLSQGRAQAVVDYLISQGIDGYRLIAKGYGEGKPVATNDTDEGRAENRRVEFVVLKK